MTTEATFSRWNADLSRRDTRELIAIPFPRSYGEEYEECVEGRTGHAFRPQPSLLSEVGAYEWICTRCARTEPELRVRKATP